MSKHHCLQIIFFTACFDQVKNFCDRFNSNITHDLGFILIQKQMFSEESACGGMKYRVRQPESPLYHSNLVIVLA